MIRKAEHRDLARILEIYNAAIASKLSTADTEEISFEEKKRWFDKHSERRPVYVLDSGNEGVVGWLSFSDFYGRPAYEYTSEVSIYIHPKFQTRGLGKKMLEFAVSSAKSLQIETLLAFVFTQNIASMQLFQRQGFEIWGELKNVAKFELEYRSLTLLGLSIID